MPWLTDTLQIIHARATNKIHDLKTVIMKFMDVQKYKGCLKNYKKCSTIVKKEKEKRTSFMRLLGNKSNFALGYNFF